MRHAMRPPLVVKKLNDHFGQYHIYAQCKACKHGRQIQPAALARIFGWDAELARIVERMRCSKCGKKQCEVTIGFDRRPRRWNTHP
jgi:hypothetical protein